METDAKPARRKIEKFAEPLVELLPGCSGYMSTGCTILDLAVANKLPGGVGAGVMTQIYGSEATAKTLLLCEVLGSAQRGGGMAYFEDAEQTFDWVRAELYGLNVKDAARWQYRVPATVEELFDRDLAKVIKERGKDAPAGTIGVDSLTALPSARELEDGLEGTGYGTVRARILSTAFRSYVYPIHQAKLAVVFVDQARTNVGVQYGEKDTTSGGRAIKFYSSTRIHLVTKGRIKRGNVVVGARVGFCVTKNKLAPPFRSGVMTILFEYGIDDITTNLEWLKEMGAFGSDGKDIQIAGEKFKTIPDAVASVEAGQVEETLRGFVAETWKAAYAPADRRPKVRF